MYKSTSPELKPKIVSPTIIIIITTLIVIGGILTIVNTKKLYITNSLSERMIFTLMITLGLASSVSFVTPNILYKLFYGPELVPAVILKEQNFLMISITITNFSCCCFTTLLSSLLTKDESDQNVALRMCSISSIISSLIGAIAGAFLGAIHEFRAESFGYKPEAI